MLKAKYKVSLIRRAGARHYQWVLYITGIPEVAPGAWLDIASGKARTYRGALLRARYRRRQLDWAAAREARRPEVNKTITLS